MPVATCSAPRVKPYARTIPSSSLSSASKTPPPNADADADVKPSIPTPVSTPTKANRGKGQPWSGNELKQLFHFALERNGRSWDEAVPGRTGSQASQTWKATIIPYLEKALEEKGNRAK